MYISGTITDFENRLHELPVTSGELTSFTTEAKGYTGVQTGISKQEIGQWNREFAKRYDLLFGNKTYYFTGALR